MRVFFAEFVCDRPPLTNLPLPIPASGLPVFTVNNFMEKSCKETPPVSKTVVPDKKEKSPETPSRLGRFRQRTYFAKMIGGIVFAALVTITLVVAFQGDSLARSLIFHPPKYPQGEWNPTGVSFEEVSFTVESPRNRPAISSSAASSFDTSSSQKSGSGDNTLDSAKELRRSWKLVGWYFPHPNPEVVILYSHGNASNITDFPRFADMLRRRYHASVLVYDYRGYGKSEGKPTTKGILQDGRAAQAWLAAKEGLKPEDIVVWGQSLGGSVAVDLAAHVGARGLIVESSFTSLPDMAKRISKALPAKALLREELQSVEIIADYQGPVFISHGRADEIIPFEQGRRLFDAANEPKTFFIPQEGEDYHSAHLTEAHLSELDSWFRSLPPVSKD